MSIINFKQRLAELESQLDRTEQKLDQVHRKVMNTKGPMDELIAEAERVGSAVADIGGQMVEMVSLNQSNWTPSLQGVVWQLYEVQKAASETKAVSRDLLDQIVPLVDKHMPQFSLWLKKLLQDAADGQITFEEMQKKIDDFASSVGVTQLNSMFHNDVPGFIREFRKLMKEIQEGKRPMEDAAKFMDSVKGKAEDATAAVKETVRTTAGMSSGAKGGSMGASGTSGGSQNGIQNGSPSGSLTIATGDLGDTLTAEEQMARMIASIQAAARR